VRTRKSIAPPAASNFIASIKGRRQHKSLKNKEIIEVQILGEEEKTVTVSRLRLSAPLQCTELSTGAVDDLRNGVEHRKLCSVARVAAHSLATEFVPAFGNERWFTAGSNEIAGSDFRHFATFATCEGSTGYAKVHARFPASSGPYS
jgi:hypothetical protein